MHMVSRKDLNSAEFETVKVQEVRRRFWQTMEKCKLMRKQQCMSKNWIYS